MTATPSSKDFPPGLQGGMENDESAHRVGETGQTGPEAPGDIDRGHSNADAPQKDKPSVSPTPSGADRARP